MINFDDFKAIFDSRFWRTLRESVVPYDDGERPKSKIEFLQLLYNDIKQFNYSPSIPRGYIIYNKHNNIARIVPTFSYRDNCVFFFCIKSLEDKIAINRIEGTFGGWRLGNSIKEKETKEVDGDYVPFLSYDRSKWSENWKEFQKRAYEYSRENEHGYFIKTDIANFYDTINLSILESKIRTTLNNTDPLILDLLFNFLGNWNKRFEGYARKTVGIPQDEIGDNSRILANFYLQDYDRFMLELCSEFSSRYLRYADDQIIFSPDQYTAREILFHASKELTKINLNMNSGKVIEFPDRKSFDLYWAFDLFFKMENIDDSRQANEIVKIFFNLLDRNENFRWESVLRRILSIDFNMLSMELRHRLYSKIYNEEFLSNTDFWYMKRVGEKTENKDEFYSILDSLINRVKYNSYHYNLLKFNKKFRKNMSNEKLLLRIEDLKF